MYMLLGWTTGSKAEKKMNDEGRVCCVTRIVAAMARGEDPVGDASVDGGIIIPDDDQQIVEIAARIEDAVKDNYSGDFTSFIKHLLMVIKNAVEENDDPIEALSTWFDALEEDLAVH